MNKKFIYVFTLIVFTFGLFSPVYASNHEPDLAITNVTLDPASPEPGETFNVNVTFENQSATIATKEDIAIDVYIYGEPVIDNTTGCPESDGQYSLLLNYPGGIAPGGFDIQAVPIAGGLPAGLYEIWVFIVDGCNLEDTEPSDNLYEATTLTLGEPVDVEIGGVNQGTYYLDANSYILQSYPGISGGPLRVISSNGVNIVSSIRLLYKNSKTETLSELMGVPRAQLSDDYSMPVYIDDAQHDSQIRFTNTSSTLSTTVNVYLGDDPTPVYTKILDPSSSDRVRLLGVTGGPLRIVGTPGVPILAGMRIIYGNKSSFDEIMALPTDMLDDEYWFPFYNHNNANLDTQIRIAIPIE